MKHAYLILAHNEFDILRILVSCLDDKRNDIYIHFDSKVHKPPILRTERSGLFVLENRIDVRWGAYSVVEAEYALFETAFNNGPYQYYHLLSGVDLPLRSQDTIHSFFDENDGKEFIGFTLTEMTPELVRKMQRWHIFPGDFKNKSRFKQIARAACLRLQEKFNILRNKGIDFKKGSQWVSVTENMARLFLDNRTWAKKTFRNTFCPDEVVFQTLFWNSPLKKDDQVRGDGEDCVRAISWRGNQMQDWSKEDFEHLRCSPSLFARKFNSSDMDFISRILELSKR